MLEPIPGGEPAPEDEDPDAHRPLRLAGTGWATVELDRAEDELGMWLGDGAGDAGGVPPDAADPHLGAFARVRPAGGLPGDSFVLLEPSTEGRLAASLARDSEGPCALYLRPAVGLTAWAAAARERGVRAQRQARRPAGDRGPARRRPDRRPASAGRRRHPVLETQRGHGYHRAMNDTAQLTIRAATAADADRLASLLTDEGYPAGPSDLARRVELFSAPGSGVLVAEQAEEALGFVAFHRIPRFESDGWFIRVVTVVVDPGARERGIAKALLAEVERLAREEGVAFLEVTRATTGRTPASCSSPWATTPP